MESSQSPALCAVCDSLHSGKHMVAEFSDKTAEVATLGGEQVKITGKDGSVHVGATKVSTADLAASNGVIHVIDTVLMPAMLPA